MKNFITVERDLSTLMIDPMIKNKALGVIPVDEYLLDMLNDMGDKKVADIFHMFNPLIVNIYRKEELDENDCSLNNFDVEVYTKYDSYAFEVKDNKFSSFLSEKYKNSEEFMNSIYSKSLFEELVSLINEPSDDANHIFNQIKEKFAKNFDFVLLFNN